MLSLRSFHLFFIAASIVLSVGLGAWGVRSYLEEGSRSGLALGALFFVVGFLLLVYGLKARRKLREIAPDE